MSDDLSSHHSRRKVWPSRWPSTGRIMRATGQNLRNQRKLLGLTMADVAERANVTVTTVSRLEHGQPIRTDILVRVLQILNLDSRFLKSTDPYETIEGQLRSIERLPERVRHKKWQSGQKRR